MRIAASVVPDTGKRAQDRLKVDMRAEMRQPLRKGVAVFVTDLSAHGCRFETREQLSADSYLWLKLPGLEALYSRVAWVAQWEAGCEFGQPLHPAVVERLVRSAQAGAALR